MMVERIMDFLKPEEDSLIGTTLMSFLLWVFAGGFAGAAAAPFFDMMERWRIPVTVGVICALAIGISPQFRGRVGVPLTAAICSLTGWFIGLVLGNWQLGSFATIAGGLAGIVAGMRVQERFTRNQQRSAEATNFYV